MSLSNKKGLRNNSYFRSQINKVISKEISTSYFYVKKDEVDLERERKILIGSWWYFRELTLTNAIIYSWN